MNTKLLYILSVSFLLATLCVNAQESKWVKSTFTEGTQGVSLQNLDAKHYTIYNLDIDGIKQQIINAPLRSQSNGQSNTIVTIPRIEGQMQQFRVVETSIFSTQDNAAQHPNIKTYLGSKTDNSGTRIRFSVTPLGFNAMISEPGKETVYIQPITKVSNGQYIVSNRSSQINSSDTFECLTEDLDISKRTTSSSVSRDANDQLLRTFRMAMSVTSEYTNFWDDGNAGNGNAQQDALAAMITTLNRTNEIFEVDMAITFQLVDTVDDPALDLIYSGTDPYGSDLNGDLQTNLTATVGEADYDIGHLLNFGGNNGNAGCIGCVCESGKGSGFSAHSFVDNDGGPYMADFFDIDYVPHEIGHQMGGNHTFSNNTEGTGVNSEPGSGTTIMGYAGITGGNDVQDHSDPYFHYHSINQILNNVNSGANQCAITTAITNNPPVADAGLDHTIPMGTAFILKGAATDADGGDTLTYTWEQIDSGQTTNSQFSPTHTGPVWRSRPPSTTPNRYMPILSRVLVGQLTESNPVETVDNTSWETVSNIGRNLNFALTVRDRSEAGGVGQTPQTDFDTMLVTVDAVSGPFTVTSQTTNVTWDAGSSQTVTWDVAGTDVGAVNTPTVNILLSVDGGLTFPFIMASDVTNDGTHDVTVPITGGDTTMARVIVEGNNNIFYAVNSTNFTIQESEFVLSVSNPVIDLCQPNDAVYNYTYNTFLGFSATTNLSVSGLPAGASAVVNPNTASMDGDTGTITVSGTGSLAVGSYPFTFQGVSGTITKSVDLTLNVFSGTLNPVVLTSPVDGAIGVDANGDLVWVLDANAIDYLVEISTDVGFTTVIESATVQTNTYATTMLNANTQYFWRVTASNDCVTASPSAVYSFTTANITCNNMFTATDTPITIASSGANANYTSIISIAEDLPITDVNVKINIDHAWNNDLDIFLISPIGTSVELTTDNGASGDDNYTDTVFDQEASTLITAGASPFTGTFIPEGDLSTIYGEMTAGDWTLSVDDDFGGADGGTILEFTLDFCVQGSLSVSEFDADFTNFTVYPNPNNGEFTVVLNNSTFDDNLSIVVYDIRGRKVYNKSFKNSNEFNQTVNLNGVESGMYLLNVTDGKKQATKKLIIK